MFRGLLVAISLGFGSLVSAQSLPVIPKPFQESRAKLKDLVITPKTRLIAKGHPHAPGPDVDAFNDMLEKEAGFRLKVVKKDRLTGSEANAIVFEWQDLADWKFYGLKVRPDRILVRTNADEAGFWSVQTMRQLITGVKKGREVRMTSCDIYDKAEFDWRGMHLDVSRHFFDGKFVRQYIDWIAEHKMNVFHWHLIDDGGWRMESKKYPKLTSMGAWRAGNGKGWDQSNLRFPDPRMKLPVYGGFYTQEEIRAIVQYARERHINVVPEIEMPGHCMPALSAYPELGCRLENRPVNNVLCPANPKAMTYAKTILDETMMLFPSRYIHIGADEVDRSNWRQCPDCQSLMKKEGLSDDAELQSWFVRQMDAYIRSKGRILVGWDEILEGGLADGATVMSWRGIEGGIEAAKQGKRVVMSPSSHCYFDYSYAQTPTDHVYTFQPVPAELSKEQGRLVLGGQANVWTEWIETTDRVEYMIFPRMAAIAESLWTPKANKNWIDFRSRLLPYVKRLEKQDIDYHPLTPNFTDRAVIFNGASQIEVTLEEDAPWPLRYTLDGSVPTLKSPIYTKPIPVAKSMSATFAYVNRKGAAGNVVTVSAGLFSPRDSLTSEPGLRRYTIKKTDGTEMKDFPPAASWSDPATAKDSAVVAGFKLPEGLTENFACLFDGWIEIKTPGVYEFEIGSDDGSRLSIADAAIVDNGGLHGYLTKVGAVTLKKGFYPIRVLYFEAGGAERLTVRWRTPGGSWQDIPEGVLRVYSGTR